MSRGVSGIPDTPRGGSLCDEQKGHFSVIKVLSERLRWVTFQLTIIVAVGL